MLVIVICSIGFFIGLCALFIKATSDITFSIVFLASIFLIGSLLNWKLYSEDKRERTTLLSYELKDSALKRFTHIRKACEVLSQSSSVWRLKSFTDDKNEPLDILKEQPPYISTDVIVWSLDSNYISLYFLPDYIFVWHDKKYGVVSYESISLVFSTNSYVLRGNAPKDATIIDYTYQHTRKDGNPDRRYKYNPAFPVMKYGVLEIKSRNGWSIFLQVSNISAARNFVDIFNREVLKRQDNKETKNNNQQKSNTNQKNTNNHYHTNTHNYQRNTNYSQQHSEQKTPSLNETILLAYEVLEIKMGATREQIIAAYREQVKSYHPDKVTQSSPKIAKLAEEKMKQINAAYETLKKHKLV